MSTTGDIINAIVTALGNVNGAGDYTYDLTATDAVVVGSIWPPPVLPFAYVRLIRVGTSDAAPLGHYARQLEAHVFGFVQTTVDTSAARTTAASDLMDDCMRAIEADRKLGILVVRDTHVEATAFDGSDDNMAPGLGVAALKVTVDYAVTTGG